MNKDIQLKDQVQKYAEQRLKRLSIILLISVSLLTLFLGSLTGGVWYLLRHARRKNEQLISEHKALTDQWKLFQISSKKLKALKAEQTLQEPSKLGSYLKSISESIPEQTLLTALTFKEPYLRLQGYTHSLEELGVFMLALNRKNIPITLKQSYHMGQILFYELTTEKSNATQEVTSKKNRTSKKCDNATPQENTPI
jgi:Tfp pilus assembly protein PilN